METTKPTAKGKKRSSSPTAPRRFVSRITGETLALVLAGGSGSRLHNLTRWHAKPAIPFGGKYRTIDFSLSNCVNSDVRRIGILTQYKSHSLINHVQKGWSFLRAEMNEFIELLPAQQRIHDSWYKGTADAIYQNLDIIRLHNPEYVLILAGDHIYKMDYGLLIAQHVEREADMTVCCIETSLAEASEFGVMSIGADERIIGFQEKPKHPIPMPGSPDKALVSMGIYVFNTGFLYEQLIKDAETPRSSHDFGKDIIPSAIDRYRVFAYPFRDVENGEQAYWRDVGTVDAFWQANMELLDVTPPLNLYDQEWPIWTHQEQLPPSKFVFDDDDGRRGMAVDSMVSAGCIVSGALVRRSLLFNNVRVNAYSELNQCVVLPRAVIGQHCRLTRAIIDQECIIPDGTVIGEDAKEDARRFHLSPEGIVLVSPEMLGQEVRHVR
ncbi:MAG TPA: glucose-1-phosphate adenylyltransferase [Pseudomonadales bacterium]|nr:glucose-1-phosphate adenylyltransferase [Pseudomonadales bacterium]HMU90634.1 glucose-1-phosphate adenylyltransferase [Pseudomonadales bacterium]HNB84490.1 glucose-1-phosphate adenylyltransferase [Pseudomonadales bacterium]HNC77435.1 glucose-1-phosphate adenylyltransferase [Pseudomonadales bacterium]HND27839.1 glucose-1-phosphate adenylyltransferase [Pseudomonadales bacterium]